jgi:uncharacterized cupredoxin-like copper-binding protein
VRRSLFVSILVAALVSSVAAPVAAARAPQNKVRLVEFEVKPKRPVVADGKTKFVVKNAGDDEHEFIIVRGAVPSALPTKADGSVDVDRIPTADQIGELQGIKPGKTRSRTYKLSAGTYILFCNLVDDDSKSTSVSHFAAGMYTTLEVRGLVPIPTTPPGSSTSNPTVTTRPERSP